MRIFDAHSDIWSDVTMRRLRGEHDVLRRCHLERLAKGGVEGSVFVIWLDPPFDQNPLKRTNEVMWAIEKELSECDAVTIVHNYEEMMKARENGKFYIFKGVEGMDAVRGDLSMLEKYYDFGCRIGTLTWNYPNALAEGVRGDAAKGLTDLGRSAVKWMQNKQMLVDLSHINDKSFWDVMNITTAPVIASHSNCRALCGNARNLTDDQLRAIRDVKGVVGLNAFNLFVDDDPKKQDVEHLARHVDHMLEIMGIDHVGCGFDFFEFINQAAMGTMTDADSPSIIGMENASQIPNLFKCFDKMGLSQEEQVKIAYGNFHDIIRRTIG